jgi:hypothetical protein
MVSKPKVIIAINGVELKVSYAKMTDQTVRDALVDNNMLLKKIPDSDIFLDHFNFKLEAVTGSGGISAANWLTLTELNICYLAYPN